MADAAVEIADVNCDREDGEGDDAEEPAQLLVAQRGADVAEQNEVIQAEVGAEEDHEHAHDDVDIGAVVVADAQRARGQAAGAGGGERMQQCVIKAHAAGDEQNRLHERERDVQQVEDGGSLADARHELADRRAGHLGAHDVHRAVAAHGQHGQHEHEDAHAADPVRKQPPEHTAAGHALRRCDDAGTGRGQTRDRLEQGVDVVRDIAREHKRDRAEQRHGDPRQADDEKTVARGDAAGLGAHAPHDQPDAAGDADRDQKRDRRFVIDHSCDHRQEHQRGLDAQHAADDLPDHSKIHGFALSMLSLSEYGIIRRFVRFGKPPAPRTCPGI